MEYMRRLSDKIIAAHKQALEEGRMDVAEILLQALELDVSERGGADNENRQSVQDLEDAFVRHEEAQAKQG